MYESVWRGGRCLGQMFRGTFFPKLCWGVQLSHCHKISPLRSSTLRGLSRKRSEGPSMPPRSHAQGQVVAKINGARKNRQEQQGSKRKQARKGLRTSSTLAEMALDLVKCVYCIIILAILGGGALPPPQHTHGQQSKRFET